jgi:predicted nucleic acid-binding protein
MPLRMLFADTFYWVALLNPRDPFHARVTSFVSGLGTARLVTTDEVLTEGLNWFSRSGPRWRA